MRLRHGGSAARWGFAVYLASKDGYQDSVLSTGDLAGPHAHRPVETRHRQGRACSCSNND